MKRYIIFTSIVIFLAACSSGKVQQEAPYSLKYEFYTETNYQQVYRTILHNADVCVQHVSMTQSIAEGHLFNEIKAADVIILQQSFLGKYPHIRIRIEVENNKTKVVVSNDFKAWDGLAKAIKAWVKEGVTNCG
jgi:hypothetical protein